MRWLPEEFYWIVSCTAFTEWDEKRVVRSAWGMNMSFRREAFDYCRFSEGTGQTTGDFEAWKAGPFDDVEFSLNLRRKSGKLIVYDPDVKVRHRVYGYRLTSRFLRGQSYWQGYTKGALRKIYPDDADMRGLGRERALLRQICLRFIPRTLWRLPQSPRLACRRLILAADVLSHVGLGYLAANCGAVAALTRGRYA